MMKLLTLFLVTLPLTSTTLAGAPKLIEKWSCGGLETPECVLYDESRQVLFVSNVAGSPTDKDGNGFISKISPDGQLLNLKWATGLNAPKGMAIYEGLLYVSDINELVAIDLESRAVVQHYPLTDAKFLNDVASDKDGNVYVDDSTGEGSAIYRLSQGKLELWLKDPAIRKPNGLHMLCDRLLVGNGGDGSIHAVMLDDKAVLPVTTADISGIDGLKPYHGGFLLSNWTGQTVFVSASGETTELMNTSAQKINSADFDLITDKHLLIIPTFFDNRVVAYKLN